MILAMSVNEAILPKPEEGVAIDWEAVVAYLNQADLKTVGANDLCERFNVPKPVAEAILFKALRGEGLRQRRTREFDWNRIRRRLIPIQEAFKRLAQNPIVFLTVTSIAGGIWFFLIQHIRRWGFPEDHPARLPLGITSVVGAVVMVVYQFAFLFQRAKSRLALLGTAIFSATVAITGFLWWIVSRAGKGMSLVDVGLGVFLCIFVALLLGAIYSACSIITVCVAIFITDREEQSRATKLNRKELLAYYFSLRKRLESGETVIVESSRFLERLRSNSIRLSWITGLGYGFVGVAISLAFGLRTDGTGADGPMQVIGGTLAGLIGLLSFVWVCLLAFAEIRMRDVIKVVALFLLASTVPLLIPFGEFGPKYVWDHIGTVIGSGVVMLLLAGFTHLGSTFYFAAENVRKREMGDTATLLAEMVVVQRRLAEGGTTIAVMVVDIVKSRDLKAGEDPLTVEHCFAQFHQWVRQVARDHSGRILSTAGDNAILTFQRASDGVTAARRMQREIAWFNQTHNRLTGQFAVRIGLHAGDVVADVHDVEYADVIDVAAHSEKGAPVGGIVATEAFIALHQDPGAERTEQTVDGWKLYSIPNEAPEEPDFVRVATLEASPA